MGTESQGRSGADYARAVASDHQTEQREPKMYRVMTPAAPSASIPAIGPTGRTLGARVPPAEVIDVLPDARGEVGPDRFIGPARQGMSVSPDIASLPLNRVPKRLRWLVPGARGKNEDVVFCMGAFGFTRTTLDDALEFVPDDGDRAAQHGVIQPATARELESFQAALARTQEGWHIDEPKEGK